jgi:hypothetical protein
VAAVKIALYSTSVLIYFMIIDAGTIKYSELNTAQAGAVGVRYVALINYPSCTDSIKSTLVFSCKFVVVNASKGSGYFQNFISDMRLARFNSCAIVQ